MGLPPCKGKSIIFVVVDILSKYAHFLLMSHPYTAHSVAQLFVDHIFKLHGMPSTIVSDRDPIFLSSFWKEFFTLQGSQLCMSSGYHPQTDDQTEVTNRGLETYLRCFCSHQPKKWVPSLPWAKWHYNTTFHTYSKLTPYEVFYGQPPPTMPTYESGATKIDLVDQSLQERNRILSQLKTNLVVAQVCMKQQADKHRSERSFEVGDMVFLRLVPYHHQSLAKHPFHKLQPRFYGPCITKGGLSCLQDRFACNFKTSSSFSCFLLKKAIGHWYCTCNSITGGDRGWHSGRLSYGNFATSSDKQWQSIFNSGFGAVEASFQGGCHLGRLCGFQTEISYIPTLRTRFV